MPTGSLHHRYSPAFLVGLMIVVFVCTYLLANGKPRDMTQRSPELESAFKAAPKQDLQDLLGIKVHVGTVKALHWYVRECILREATPL